MAARRPDLWHAALAVALAAWAWGCDQGALSSNGTEAPRPDLAGRDLAAADLGSIDQGRLLDGGPGRDGGEALDRGALDLGRGPADATLADAAHDAVVDLDAARLDASDGGEPGRDASVADACVPLMVCPARACGPVPDGCGDRLACGGCVGADEICLDRRCVPEDEALLVERPGEFFVADVPGARHTIRLEPGPAYERLTIDVFAVHGGWRVDLFDREILSHNLWGLSRIANRSVERYLLGVGAQIRTLDADLRRRLLYYARVDLAERPAGQGHEGYTSFRRDFAWEIGTTYRLRAVVDIAAREQRLEVMVDDQVVARLAGPIEYLTPALTTSGFTLDFAGDETDHRDVTPVGWRFSDLRVTGRLAR